jgi:hypothetical protein
MNGNSPVNEDVKWMKILLCKMIVVYMPATVFTYLLTYSMEQNPA